MKTVLSVIVAGIVLGAGSAIFENSKVIASNQTEINNMTKAFDKYEARIMKRFDRLELIINGN